jgi:hypothetical protein
MSISTKESKLEHMAVVRRITSSVPDISIANIKLQTDKMGYNFPVSYICRLKSKIATERALRYDRQTKSTIVAQFEDFIKALEPKLRTISSNGKDRDKLEAIKILVSNYRQLIDLQMDLGVIERNLGTIKTENYHFDIVKLAKLVEKVNKEKENDRGNNFISDSQ